MDTINRLQFRHHDEIFDDRCKAIEYIYDKIKENGEGLASEQNSPYSYSLFAEPTILRYKNETDEIHDCEGDETCEFKKGPHIMLVIGSETNDTIYHERNRFCIIDIDKTEEEIRDLEEELAKAVKSLTLAVFDTSTLDLHVEKTEDGTFLSGDVKTAKTHVFEGNVKDNNLMIVPFDDEAGPEGLFIYVDLTYDEPNETFTFTVSQADGTLKKTSVKLPNNYLVSGEYKKQDESLHLHMRNGDEVIVDCEELIAEWNVEGDASKTPIVLTKEEVDYDGTDEHHHVEPWQDVLRADVRIADDRPANILKKTVDGRYLYVDGIASNIVYYWNGDKSNVKEQLDKLNKIKISQDNDNIIWERSDGYFASIALDYISNENKLILTTSSVNNGEPIRHEVQLNSFDVIESITYDPTREELVIKYRNDKGEIKTVRVPISAMIDEWDVLNTAHSVKLVRQRKTSGKDILTADVNISSLEDNILEEKSEQGLHTLYVRGTASNIKYGNGTVKDALDDLIEEDENINKRIDDEIVRATTAEEALDEKINQEIDDRTADVERIDTTIGSGFSIDAHETVTYKFEQLQNQVNSEAEKLQSEIERSTSADTVHDGRLDTIETEIGDGFGPRFTIEDAVNELSADTRASLKHVINEDNSINVVERDGAEGKEAVVKVNLSSIESGNTIRLEGDGLYNFIDLNYDPDTNKLTLTKSDTSSTENKTKELQLNSVSFIDDITYDPTTETLTITYHSGAEEKKVEINLGQIFQEWEVYNDPNSAVKLYRERVIDGKDKLSGEVVITTAHTDNILVNDHGALYVPANTDVTAALSGAIDAVDGKIDAETIRAISAETALSGAISTVNTNLQNEIQRSTDKDVEHDNKLSAETAARMAEDNILRDLITEETLRAQAADNELYQKIADETAARISGDSALDAKIAIETARAEVIENTIQENLESEVERSTVEDERLWNALSAETAARQQGDDELEQMILDATLTFSPSSGNFESNGTILFNDYREDGNVVKANVILQGSDDNIIKAGTGLYATVHMSYDIATNKLKLTTSAGSEEFQLAGATVIDNLYYDNESGEIVITYHDGSGNVQVMKFPASELFNEWIVQNPSEKSAVELTKTRATEQGQPDELKARVLITDDRNGDGKPDDGSDNLIEIRNNGLYVCGSGNTLAECVSGKTDAIYKSLFGGTVIPSGCGDGIEYVADPLSCVISGATSFMEADRMMAYQICEILEMWVSGETCTSISDWVDEGANKKMLVDVKASRGNTGTMTDDEITIQTLTGDYIDPTRTEFTDTNALRIVCLQDGGSGVKPAVDTPQNGLYLSNVWDCGLYYGPQDTEAKAAAEAAGYITDYYTDEDESASNYNYMNNVRQSDIPHP